MPESYTISKVEDEVYGIVYTFSTPKFGYTIYFNDSVYADLVAEYKYLSAKSYSFGFFNEDLYPEKKNFQDPNVSYTIIKIVEDLFQAEGSETVVLFHCDGADTRQLMRHKTFTKWYRDSEIIEFIKMNPMEVEVGETKHYMGFICHINNQHIPELTQEFESVAQKLAPNTSKTK